MKTILNDNTGKIWLFPNHFSRTPSLDNLEGVELRQESIRLFGKEILQPRLSALYGEQGVSYKYSGRSFDAILWPRWLEDMAKTCGMLCEAPFNSVLLNYYRNGTDSMGLHADNEKELGENPVIASVSFGATRKMIFRKSNSKEKQTILLQEGDLLVMKGALQHHWKHELPKAKNVEEPRLNLTFRWVK